MEEQRVIYLEDPTLLVLRNESRKFLIERSRELGLPADGKKAEIFERLCNYYGYTNDLVIVRRLSTESEDLKFEPRDEGTPFLIGKENTELMSKMMGLSSHIGANTIERFSQLANNLQELSDCYENPNSSFKINKKICRWCTNKIQCDSKEMEYNNKHMLFEIQTTSLHKKSKSISADLLVIEKFLTQKEYVVQYPLKRELIFSSEIDMFKPGFGGNSSRKINIIPFNYIQKNTVTKSQWSHLFYSKILGRTLTVFEAMLINSMNPIRYDEEGTESFPKISQVKRFYSESLGVEIENDSKSSFFEKISRIIPNANMKNMNEDSRLFWSKIIENTRNFIDTGMFNITVEVLYHYDEKQNFYFNLTTFLWEIFEKLDGNHSQEGDLFLNQRIDVILLTNDKRVLDLELLEPYRIIRVINYPNISYTWAIIDGEITKLYSNDMVQTKISEPENHALRYGRLDQMLNENIIHGKDFGFQMWDSGDRVQNSLCFVSVFDHTDLFEAYTMHEYLINLKLNQNDERFFEMRRTLGRFIERMFFFKVDGLKIFRSEEEHFIKKLRKSLNNAFSKHYNPYRKLVTLAEEFPAHISFKMDPDKTDRNEEKQTFEFKFTSRYDTEDQCCMETVITIRKSYTKEGEKISDWHLYSQLGFEIFGQNKILRQLYSCLEYSPEKTSSVKDSDSQIYISENLDLGLYISRNVEKLLHIFAREKKPHVFSKLGQLFNSYSNQGVLCLALTEEFEKIINAFGESEHREHIIDGNVLIAWNPQLPARTTSQNVLFTGRSISGRSIPR